MKKRGSLLFALILFATFVGTAFAADNTLYLFTPTTGCNNDHEIGSSVGK